MYFSIIYKFLKVHARSNKYVNEIQQINNKIFRFISPRNVCSLLKGKTYIVVIYINIMKIEFIFALAAKRFKINTNSL